ncbi:hypothetical protein ACFP51_09575 [Streptomyces pratens]|uniref:Uncharacterized protein n=1 Tax=Streptomyces pratens TaxID=887456 RepID=A0ABW1LXY3_9ACTN
MGWELRLVGAEKTPPADAPICHHDHMEYGLFEYASAPHIFLNRTGVGPLHVAWDTNILIDYLQFGRALWSDEDLGIDNTQHAEQVDAIGQIIDPYFCFWDIRIYLFDEILDDARRAR